MLALNNQTAPGTRVPRLEAGRLPDLALGRFGGGRDVWLRHAHCGQLSSRLLVHLIGEGLLRVSIVLCGEVRCRRALVVMVDLVVGMSTAAEATSARVLAGACRVLGQLGGVFGRLGDWVRAVVLRKLTVSVSLLLCLILPDAEQTVYPGLPASRSRLLLLLNGHSSILLLHLLALDLVLILVLEAVELVVLQQDALLNHGLVRLSEEVVLLHVHLVWRHAAHFSHIPLQRLLRILLLPALQTLLPNLLMLVLLAATYLLLVHARELLGRGLLD